MKERRNFTKEEIDNIILDYNNGMCPKDLGIKYDRDSGAIITKLQSLYIYTSKNVRWTNTEVEYLKTHYSNTDWGELLIFLYRHKKEDVLDKACSLNISKDDYYWSDDDLQILKDNYEYGNINNIVELLNNRFTYNAITTKANLLGVKSREYWSDDEIKTLKQNYEIMKVDDILTLLPNRNKDSIKSYAHKLGLKSPCNNWTDIEKQFIIDNWHLTPDIIMAKKLNRTFRSVKWQREQLGLFRRNNSEKNYETISKYIRSNITEWKNDSMESSNYKCVLTDSKDFQIHHLYSVSLILKATFEELHIELKGEFKDYIDDELKFILDKFIEIQNRYPLGECVDKKLHVLFHSLYGQYYNIPEQWYKFKEDYKNGLYNDMLKKSA